MPRTEMIRFQTLGRIALLQDGVPLGQRLMAQPRRLALLTYLLVRSPDGGVSRDELLGIFWGDRSEREARKCLSQALHFIRNALGSGIITATRTHVTVDRTLITCDAAEVLEFVARSSFCSAVDAYTGQFLPGFTVGIPEADQWIDVERARLERAALKACMRAAEDKALEEDRVGAAKYAFRSADINALDEDAAVKAMRLLGEIECDKEAVAVYEKHASALKSEIDEVPSAEATAIADGIRRNLEALPPCSPMRSPALGTQTPHGRPKQRIYEHIVVGILSMAVFALLVSSYGWRREIEGAPSAVPTVVVIDGRQDALIPAHAAYREVLEHMIRELSLVRGLTVRIATPESGDGVTPPNGPVVIVRLDQVDAGSDSSGVHALILAPSTGKVLASRRDVWLDADPAQRKEIAARLATAVRKDLGAAVAHQEQSKPPAEASFATITTERTLADSLRLSGAHGAARSLLTAVETQLANMNPSPDLRRQLGVQRSAVAFERMWLELALPHQDERAARAALSRGLEAVDNITGSHSGDLELMTAKANLLFWSWHTAPPESLAAATNYRTDARRLLETVVGTAPGHTKAWVQLSSIYDVEENYTAAYRAARVALDTDVFAKHRMELATRLYTIALELADTAAARRWCTYLPRDDWARAQCELTAAFHRAEISRSELVRLRELTSNVPADSWSAPRLSLLFAAVLGVAGHSSEARRLIAENGDIVPADPEIDLFRAMAALGLGNTATARHYLQAYISVAPAQRSHIARSRTFALLSEHQ